MPIESPNQRQLPFSDDEGTAHASKLSDDVLKDWDKVKAMTEAEAKAWLVVAVTLLFSQDDDDEDDPAAEACAWRSELLPRWIHRRGTFC